MHIWYTFHSIPGISKFVLRMSMWLCLEAIIDLLKPDLRI